MRQPVLAGVAAALAAAVMGALWQVLTRHGVTTSVGPLEIALLRYGIPAFVLLPVLWRVGLRPAGMSWPSWAMLVAGGLPFGLLVFAGARWAPASHIGIFMAGTMPLFTALACWLLRGEAIQPLRWLGFAFILAGVAWLGLRGSATGADSWRGDLLFLLAAAAWACHTLAFRGSGLGAWQGAAVVNGCSAIAVLVLLPFAGVPRLLAAPWTDLLLQGLGQGVMAGLLGLVAYLAAVSRLGSARAALSAALVPPLTTLAAHWILGEPAGAETWGAASLVALGVACASGAFARSRPEVPEGCVRRRCSPPAGRWSR